MREILVFVGLCMVLPSAAITALVYLGNIYVCGNYERITGIPTKAVFIDQCYVQVDSRWMLHEEYKATLVAERGLKGEQP